MRASKVIFILLSIVPFLSSAQWQWQNPLPQGNSIADIYFINQNIGFAAGAYGTILKTINAGESWQIVSSGTNMGITKIHCPSQNIGYAVGGNYGSESMVIKTNNGGQTWDFIFQDSSSPFWSVFFVNNQIGFVGGDSGFVMKTVDGGVSWIALSTGSISKISEIVFVDSNTGFIAGDNGTMLKTTDGGVSWLDISSYFSPNSTISSISFPDPAVGFALSNSGSSKIAKTVDGGASWDIIYEVPWTLTDLFFMTIDTGFVTGMGISIRTSNGGNSWETLESPLWLGHLFFTNVATGYLVGGNTFGFPCNPVIMKTTNFGEAWVYLAGNTSVPLLYHVEFLKRNIGFAVGGFTQTGQVIRTLDGHTWELILNTGDTALKESQFLNENIGYVFGEFESNFVCKSILYLTTTGGESWNTSILPGQLLPYSISFINDSTGFLSGNSDPFMNGNAKLYKTSSWGASWDLVVSDTFSNYPAIKFTSEDTGYLLKQTTGSASGVTTIFKSIDSGVTWNQIFFVNDGPPSTLYFFNNEFGFLIPQSCLKIYRTTDGGISWDTIYVNTLINSIHFVNNLEGFSAGNNGQISKSDDGGETWTPIASPTNIHLFDLYFFSSDTGYIVGDQGTILFTADGGYPVHQYEYLNKSSIFLSNYPNPFSNTTTITCNLTSISDLSIEIYRLTGEVIKSTYIMRQPAGKVEISFDASNIPSGIYMYRLKANDIVETKKMIVIH